MPPKKNTNVICETLGPKTFTFGNGDKYVGQYIIDQNNNEIFRHGYGTYESIKGLKVSGDWIKDKISAEVQIEYRNQMIYKGFLSKSMSYTVGEVNFFDGSNLSGDFKKNFENQRIDGVKFTDPNGKIWNHSINEENEILLEFDWKQDLLNCEMPCDKLPCDNLEPPCKLIN